MSSEKVSLQTYVSPSTRDIIEQISANSRERSDCWDMSKSEVARHLIEAGIKHLGKSPEMEEMVSETKLEHHRKQQEYDEVKTRGKIEDMRGGWRGRVRSRLNGRLSGAEPYHPDVIESLSDHYYREIEIWESDEDRLEEHRLWLEERLEEYRESWECKQLVPDEEFSDAVDDVGTGADLFQLRDQFGDFISDLQEMIDSERFDSDAILRSIANEYGIEQESVEIALDALLEEEKTHRYVFDPETEIDLCESVDRDRLSAWADDRSELPGGMSDD
jgi:hypothetical protein